MKPQILALEVGFVAHQESGDFIVCVGTSLVKPLGNVVKGLAVGDIVDEDDSDGSTVVGTSDRLESLLSGLNRLLITVSHICNLMGLP
jgi:hypothetical protein